MNNSSISIVTNGSSDASINNNPLKPLLYPFCFLDASGQAPKNEEYAKHFWKYRKSRPSNETEVDMVPADGKIMLNEMVSIRNSLIAKTKGSVIAEIIKVCDCKNLKKPSDQQRIVTIADIKEFLHSLEINHQNELLVFQILFDWSRDRMWCTKVVDGWFAEENMELLPDTRNAKCYKNARGGWGKCCVKAKNDIIRVITRSMLSVNKWTISPTKPSGKNTDCCVSFKTSHVNNKKIMYFVITKDYDTENQNLTSNVAITELKNKIKEENNIEVEENLLQVIISKINDRYGSEVCIGKQSFVSSVTNNNCMDSNELDADLEDAVSNMRKLPVATPESEDFQLSDIDNDMSSIDDMGVCSNKRTIATTCNNKYNKKHKDDNSNNTSITSTDFTKTITNSNHSTPTYKITNKKITANQFITSLNTIDHNVSHLTNIDNIENEMNNGKLIFDFLV